MAPLTKYSIAKIDRIRSANIIIMFLRLLFVTALSVFTAYSVFTGQFFRYGYTITSLLLTANIIWCASDFFNNNVVRILETMEYKHAKWKFEKFNKE